MITNKFCFIHPARCVITGPSCSGKTVFIQKLIKNYQTLFSEPPQRIIYTYKYVQNWFDQFRPLVEFVKEIPKTLDSSIPSLLIFDDLLCDPIVLKEAVSYFTRGSHHLNCSVFFLTQNLYSDSSHYRTISLNASYFVLFKTIRGLHQIEHLGRQIFGKRGVEDFLEAYKDATQQPYTYLVVDLTPTSEHRLRSNIFAPETEIVYLQE